jgi:energy-converting hydrogenase Eha subunit G
MSSPDGGPDGGRAASRAAGREDRPPWRLWDHIGRLSGAFLGLLVFGFLVFLAVAGDTDAWILIVLIVAGVLLIVLGSRLGLGQH